MAIKQITHDRKTTIFVDPTLIVGLGGTGALICQWVYHLMKGLFGTVPPFVKMAVFDSDVQEEGGPCNIPDADFFNLFEDLTLSEVLRDFKRQRKFHPHLEWLGDMSLDSTMADRGCQGLSRLGRVVFFELENSIIQKEIEARFAMLKASVLKREMSHFELQHQFRISRSPKVHIVCSICGGTGSGLLLDTAYGLRRWSRKQLLRTADISGHLMLPEAFDIRSERILQKLQAVACATLQQIELLCDARRRPIRVTYADGRQAVFTETDAPFTFCHLLNGLSAGGGERREQLVEMIARVIRAICVEPVGKTIASDANNKQTDALALFDKHTGRKTIFSSYGLHYGTPGSTSEQKKNLVKRWVYSTLGAFSIDVAQRHEAQDEEIDASVNNAFNFNKRQDELAQFVNSFEEFSPEPDTSGKPQQHMSGELDKYLDKLSAAVQKEAKEKYSSEKDSELIEQVRTMINSNLVSDPAYCEAAFAALPRWCQSLRAIHGSVGSRDMGAVRQLIRSAAFDSIADLDEVNRQIALSDGTFQAAARKAISDHAFELAAAAVRPGFDRQVKNTQLAIEIIEDNIEKLKAAAEQEAQKLGSEESMRATGYGAFATPLYELEEPTNFAKEEALSGMFYEQLVDPILRLFLDDEPRNLNEIAKRLRDMVDGSRMRTEMTSFLSEYESVQVDLFRSPLGGSEASDHHYYETTRDIFEACKARISLDQARRYAETEDVLFTQHVPRCCIPDLLRPLTGQMTYRPPGLVSRAFEEQEGVWATMAHFRYGFCLEALDNYADYEVAVGHFLDWVNLKPSDLWLDPNWYGQYQGLLVRCEQHARDRANRETAREQHETAAKVRDGFLAAFAAFFDAAERACAEFPFGDDFDAARECYRRIYGASERIQCKMRTARADTPLQVLRDVAAPAQRQIDLLHQNMLKIRPGLGEKLQVHLEQFRKDFRQCFGAFDEETQKECTDVASPKRDDANEKSARSEQTDGTDTTPDTDQKTDASDRKDDD
jgi:hypothetical protein